MKMNWDNHDEVVAFAKRQFQFHQQSMYPYYQEWYTNIAFYRGEQNLRWDTISKQLISPPAPSWRSRFVFNIIQPSISTLMSKLIKARPWLDVLPATGDIEDGTIAFKNKRVLQFYWEYLKLNLKHLDFLFWYFTTGNAFYKVTWNPRAGDIIEASPTDLLLPEDTLDQKNEIIKLFKKIFDLDDTKIDFTKKYELPVGDINVEIPTPFEMIIPDGIKDLDSSPWIMQSSYINLETIHDLYGKKVNDIETGDVDDSNFQKTFERKIKNLTKFGTRSTADDYKSNYVRVLELWVKASRKYPRGKRFIIIKDQIRNEQTENPYNHKKYPYIHCREIQTGRFWATSTISQLIDIQKNYNRTRNQLIENRETMGSGRWLVPSSAKVSDQSFTGEPNERIEYKFPFKPEQLDIKPLPSYIERILLSDRTDLQDISGQHEVSRGQVPGQVRSGSAIERLQEADDMRLNRSSLIIDEGLSQLGSFILDVASQFIREQRLGSILGDESSYETFYFTGSQLVGENNGPGVSYFRVRVKTFSQLPMSKSAQQDMVERMIQNKILDPMVDRALILTMLDLGSTQEQIRPTRNSRAQALRENHLMSDGEQVQPQEWQNHDIHITVHKEFMDSPQFERVEEEIRNFIIAHYRMHMELRAQQQVYPEILLAKHMELGKRMASQTLGAPENGNLG